MEHEATDLHVTDKDVHFADLEEESDNMKFEVTMVDDSTITLFNAGTNGYLTVVNEIIESSTHNNENNPATYFNFKVVDKCKPSPLQDYNGSYVRISQKNLFLNLKSAKQPTIIFASAQNSDHSKFIIKTHHDGTISLKASNNKYVTVTDNLGVLEASSDTAKASTRFNVEKSDDNKYSLQSEKKIMNTLFKLDQ